MRNTRLLRNFGLVAGGLIAAAAIACGGSDSDFAATAGSEGASVAPSVGSGESFPGSAADGGDAGKAFFDSSYRDEATAAGAPAGNGAGPVAAGGALVSQADRKIISTASVQLQVENVGGSFEEVGRIATSVGGFVASSSFSYVKEDQLASVTIRVPSESYQSVLASLRRLGVKVDSETSNATDVTEEYTDLGSRLRTLEATETQLLTLLARAESISDILTVQDRLNYTRGEIEHVKGRMQLLDDLTALATVTVHLRPVVGADGGSGDGVDLGAEVAEAWDASIEFLGNVAAAVVTVVVFAWWVPLAGLPLLLGYRAMARRQQAPVASGE